MYTCQLLPAAANLSYSFKVFWFSPLRLTGYWENKIHQGKKINIIPLMDKFVADLANIYKSAS